MFRMVADDTASPLSPASACEETGSPVAMCSRTSAASSRRDRSESSWETIACQMLSAGKDYSVTSRPFTLLRSGFSVRVQVRFGVPGSSFRVRLAPGQPFRARGDSAFPGPARISKRLRRLQVFHQPGDFFQGRFREGIQLSPRFLGDVALVDRVAQLALRLHQRRARYHGEPREIGRVEPAEPFGDMVRRAADRFLDLDAALQVLPIHAGLDDAVDGLLVRIARLPGTQVGESANTSHANTRSTRRARQDQA